MEKFIKNIKYEQIIGSIVVIIISVVLYKIIISLLTKGENNDNLHLDKKGKTYIRLFKNIIRNVFIILTVVILLQINGVNISSILAGIGIVSVIIGLAIQDWLKDIIRGTTILTDHYFAVGDIVKFNDIEGQVVVIGLRTTKVKDYITGNFVSIANRNIEKVEIVSAYSYINVPLPYELKLKDAEKIIDDILSDILQNVKEVISVKYLGVNELASSSINYLLQIESKPQVKRQVKRDSLRSTLLVLEKHKVSVPYNQLDIHQK